MLVGQSGNTTEYDSPVALGKALFFDTALSVERNQACATCHDPERAFSDGRDNGVGAAASLGSDGRSLGDRNAPALTYIGRVPDFGRDADDELSGGFFHDGRAHTLAEQAAQPLTNHLEMALPDAAAVVERVSENSGYRNALRRFYGVDVDSDADRAFGAITASIAAYERSMEFSSFDSKYDRFLRNEATLTPQEEIGRMLFYSQLINCHSCHLLDSREFSPEETFTNHRYHNIGVPVNTKLRELNGMGTEHRDPGLLANPAVNDPAQSGKYRVPTLRNVAVTGPFMHNGVFAELATAIRFYNRFLLTDQHSQTNPETGKPWDAPEIAETIDLELLRLGQPLSEMQISALVAFLRTLTDQRYEHLLEPPDD